MKKVLSFFLAVIIALGCFVPAFAADVSKIGDYKAKFKGDVGPEVNGLSVDYMYFKPKTSGNKKYPLVIYFHGMGQGSEPGSQIRDNNVALWASPDLQKRFTNGGAYLFVPRTHEENGEYWDDEYVFSVKAAIDEFIKENKAHIDTTRIYVGGFSMGGKMTLKMATSYPDFFAAAFPMCPAYIPTDAQFKSIENMPIWLITSRFDILAGWYVSSEEIWNGLKSTAKNKSNLRLSLMGRVCYPDGTKTPSNHHVWFAMANDMFTYDEGEYPYMVTYDGNDKEIKLKSPDGLIKWLCSKTSTVKEKRDNTALLADNNESLLLFVLKALGSIKYMFCDTVKTHYETSTAKLKEVF